MKGVRFAVLAATLLGLGFALFAEKPWTVAERAAEFARENGDRRPPLEFDVARGLWFGFLACGAAGCFLTLYWKHWCRPLRAPDRSLTRPAEHLSPFVFWLLVGAAVALGGALRWPLATKGLWWDELWSVKHASLGYLKPVGEPESGEFRFLRRGWDDTLWGYSKPTNHPPASASSRISQAAWRGFAKAEPHAFDPLAVRLPMLAAGLVSILAIAVLVRRWGFPIGAVAAAFFLAVHPWHMRYGVEARSYSFAVLWAILACLWLSFALADERGRWRYWLLFGLNQLLLTWSLPNGFYYAATFTLAGAALAFHQWRPGEGRRRALWRLVAVNVMAAMVFLPLFMPNVLQMLRWGEINDHATLTLARLKEALANLSFGMDLAPTEGPEGLGIPSLHAEFASSPWASWITFGLLAVGITVGIVRLASNRLGGVVLLGAIATAALASLAVIKAADLFFYPRYIIYALVPFAVLFGIGLAGFSRGLTKGRLPAALVGLAVLGLYLYTTRAPRTLLISRPYAPFEEVAAHLETRRAAQPDLRVIGYGLGGRVLGLYAPATRFAKNKGDLARELQAAEAAAAPYVIVLGYEGVNRKAPEYRDGFEILDQPGRFAEARQFAGIDPLFYFKVLEPTPLPPPG